MGLQNRLSDLQIQAHPASPHAPVSIPLSSLLSIPAMWDQCPGTFFTLSFLQAFGSAVPLVQNVLPGVALLPDSFPLKRQ